MKKLILVIAGLLLATVSVAYAATSAAITVAAEVPTGTELSWGMSMVDSNLTTDPADDIWTDTGTTGNMSFGTLRHTLSGNVEAGLWYSQYYYAVFLGAMTGGVRYRFQNTAGALTRTSPTTATIPAGAFGVAKVACWDTTNDVEITCPSGSTKGTIGTAVATNKILYDSGSGAAVVTVRVDYSLPPYGTGGTNPWTGFAPIPLSQGSGSYSSSLTISLVTY